MKFIGLVLFLLVSSTQLIAQEAAPANCNLAAVIAVDGNADEWPLTWEKDDGKDQVYSFNVCTDENNLYVRVRTGDYYAKRKMAAFGFTVWIDASGKKKKKLGLKFPTGGAEAQERANSLKEAADDAQSASDKAQLQKEIDRKLIENLEVLELIGLADDPITSTRSGITNGIKVAIAVDSQGGYVYEALIPFKSFRLSRSTMKELSVGFESGKYVPKAAKTSTRQESDRAFTGATQMSRYQGYSSLIGNPRLTYTSYAWARLKFK